MKKIRQAEENEKKEERQGQKSRYEDALPADRSGSATAFKGTIVKNNYSRAIILQTVTRSYAILQPPKVA